MSLKGCLSRRYLIMRNPIDDDTNNIYEISNIVLSNLDGGNSSFSFRVFISNQVDIFKLITNRWSTTVTVYTSNIIDDLTSFILDDGAAPYSYSLSNDDARYFRLEGDLLKTTNEFGFRSVYENNSHYDFQVLFVPDLGTNVPLTISVRVSPETIPIPQVGDRWPPKAGFQSVVLTNGDVLVLGGYINTVWLSSDGGTNWNEITNTVPWRARDQFQSVVLTNNDVLVMGGWDGEANAFLNDIWLSTNGGINWSEIPVSNHWSPRHSFQTVVLTNNDILVIGGVNNSFGSGIMGAWSSTNGGTNWNYSSMRAIIERRYGFQSVVLTNNDILALGGFNGYSYNNNVWISSDEAINWVDRTSSSWPGRYLFQSVILTNDVILVMGGLRGVTHLNDIWQSSDGGINWNNITPLNNWGNRRDFQTVVLPNNDVLVMGGRFFGSVTNDIWLHQSWYNENY